MALWFVLAALLSPAAAAEPAPAGLSSVEVTPEGFRASYDVVVRIGGDGTLTVDGDPAVDSGVEELVAARSAKIGSDARVVVSADPRVPYARVIVVLELVQAASPTRVALEIGAGAQNPVDPLSPIGQDVVNLDETEFGDSFDSYRPKRHEYPQNPYGSTDFTAYTREKGEVRIGLASTSYGILPRTQVGTYPLLDLLGVYNIQGKWNFARTRKFDLAMSAGTWVVPITKLLESFDGDGKYKVQGKKVKEDDIFVKRINYFTFGVQGSWQLWKGLSVHGGVGYSRANATGNLDFKNLPVIIVPGGGKVGGDLTLTPQVTGQLVDLRFATDYRFNRRDSLIFQWAATTYVSAEGKVSADLAGLSDTYKDFDLALSYSQRVRAGDSFRASLAYQFSWRKIDLRVGAGWSAIPTTWLFQAFDLSYRFGGATRRAEHKVRKAYREDRQEIDAIEGIDFAPPPEDGKDDE